MEWIKLDLRTLRSPAYIGSEPIARATWLNLLAYCADEENGGRIRNCAGWKDRMWQQLVGVTLEEVHLETDLIHWDGDDLVVEMYPTTTESMVKARRSAGKKGGENFASSKPEANPDFASSKPEAKSNFASTEQTRAEKSRAYKSRAEGAGCRGLGLEAACDWIDLQNGSIPDKLRAKNLAAELIEEMDGKDWRIDGQPVSNPMGLLINRLKKDKAYKP